MKTLLILGGTQMLGRDLVEKLRENINYDITLANRGITNPNIFPELKHIRIDRNSQESCLNLSKNIYDYVVDFSCYTSTQFKNVSQSINCNNYIYISTISVFDAPKSNNEHFNEDSPHGRYLKYCTDKKNVEMYILNTEFTYKIFIIRPCAVYGKNDYTDRFEQRGDQYYWKNTNIRADEKTNCTHVSIVTQKLIEILENQNEDITKKYIFNIGKPTDATLPNQ